jgi:prepilin peptidase CpaA
MSGTTEAGPALIYTGCVIALVTDLWRGRIFNWLTLPMIVAGLVLGGLQGGWAGLGAAFLGSAIALLLYGWMFFLGFMGGGDVKFLMALGALGGARYGEEVALLALFVGGAMSLAILVFKGRIISLGRRLWLSLQTLLVKELEFEFPKVDRKLTFPFGVPLAIAAIWVLRAHPLEGWGIPFWP